MEMAKERDQENPAPDGAGELRDPAEAVRGVSTWIWEGYKIQFCPILARLRSE
jgi:hypothetical protein